MSLRRRLAIALVVLSVASSTALAVRAPRRRGAHDRDLVALPGAGVAGLRTHVELQWSGVPAARSAAWQRLRAAVPGLEHASWDRATHVPNRIWGRGLDVPGSVADPAIAAAAARRFLLNHLDLLAPGASISDFDLVANVLERGMRTVGLIQRHAGVPVVGGQLSFRFKRDRLFVIGSEALPHVQVRWPGRNLESARLAAGARTATIAELGLDPARVTTRAIGARAIIPLIGDRGVLGYRLATPIELDAGADGRWRIWTDPDTGVPLVRQSLTRYASGVVNFNAVSRWPGSTAAPRRPYPAPGLSVTIGGVPAVTNTNGAVSWSGGSAQVVTSVQGARIAVENQNGPAASRALSLSDGGAALWSPGDDRDLDAQLSAYIHADLAKRYVRTFAPDLAFLDELLAVRVNIADECNAYSDGDSIHFFQASERCENTATLADVVYHEFGHSMHAQSLIPGVGFFDIAFSEGLSDYLAAAMTGDSGMGRGFFKNDEPLREIDPPDREHSWPLDIGEVHFTGLIFAGAMWDLRTALIAEAPATGAATADALYYGAVRRASSIPSTIIEILAEDDDDGDLTNGTPHECTIRSAFGKHGLRTIGGEMAAPATIAATTAATSVAVSLTLAGEDQNCGDEVTAVVLEHRRRTNDSLHTVAASPLGGDTWTAEFPLPEDGSVTRYRMRVSFADGSELVFPDNLADSWQELYRGDLMPLYCTDFETDPFAEGWRADDSGTWQWGSPPANSSYGDPSQAYSGTRVLGTGLAIDADTYPPGTTTWVETPEIALGQWSDVRLHYRRWLGVEDGYFDQAEIAVDGSYAWGNFDSRGNSDRTLHHEDRSWIFNDVSISSRITDRTARIRWSIAADNAFELGGWTLDDVCVVANINSVCGDGERTGAEQCDEGAGNADVADTCRTICRVPNCGDSITDTVEECDDGNQDDTDDCSHLCTVVLHPDADGCCAASRSGAPDLAAPLTLLVLGLRRRRRTSGHRTAA